MKSPFFKCALVSLLVIAIAFLGTGCSKKVTPPPATAKTDAPSTSAAPAAPAPTIRLSASPSTIEQGQSSTLTWNTSDATSVTIDGGIGTVEPSGRRAVAPMSSTTYAARAAGPGGSATAETRVTVTPPAGVSPPPARAISDSEFFASYIKDVFYDYDSYELRDDSRQTLRDNARALAERGTLRLSIEGHCDERGSEKYNLALGDMRANAAKEFLVAQGIPSDRIDTVSLGEERPFAPGHDESAWSQNRRAHFVLK